MLRARIFCLIENSSKKSLLNEASSLHIKINRVKKIKVQLLINIFSSQKKGGADNLTRHPLCESSLRSGINFTCEKETVLVEDFYACLLCDLSAKQENVTLDTSPLFTLTNSYLCYLTGVHSAAAPHKACGCCRRSMS